MIVTQKNLPYPLTQYGKITHDWKRKDPPNSIRTRVPNIFNHPFELSHLPSSPLPRRTKTADKLTYNRVHRIGAQRANPGNILIAIICNLENNQSGCATCLNPRVDIARSPTDYNSQPITKHVFLDSPSVAGDVGQGTDAAGHSSSAIPARYITSVPPTPFLCLSLSKIPLQISGFCFQIKAAFRIFTAPDS